MGSVKGGTVTGIPTAQLCVFVCYKGQHIAFYIVHILLTAACWAYRFSFDVLQGIEEAAFHRLLSSQTERGRHENVMHPCGQWTVDRIQ